MLTFSIIHFAKLLLQVRKDHMKLVLMLQFCFSKLQYSLPSLFGNIYMPIKAGIFRVYLHSSKVKEWFRKIEISEFWLIEFSQIHQMEHKGLFTKAVFVPVAWSVTKRQNHSKHLLIICYLSKPGLYRFSKYFTYRSWFTFLRDTRNCFHSSWI